MSGLLWTFRFCPFFSICRNLPVAIDLRYGTMSSMMARFETVKFWNGSRKSLNNKTLRNIIFASSANWQPEGHRFKSVILQWRKVLCNKSLREALFLPSSQNTLGATSALLSKGITSNKSRQIVRCIKVGGLLETAFFLNILFQVFPLHPVFDTILTSSSFPKIVMTDTAVRQLSMNDEMKQTRAFLSFEEIALCLSLIDVRDSSAIL